MITMIVYRGTAGGGGGRQRKEHIERRSLDGRTGVRDITCLPDSNITSER